MKSYKEWENVNTIGMILFYVKGGTQYSDYNIRPIKLPSVIKQNENEIRNIETAYLHWRKYAHSTCTK